MVIKSGFMLRLTLINVVCDFSLFVADDDINWKTVVTGYGLTRQQDRYHDQDVI